jgi:hypothetical protein
LAYRTKEEFSNSFRERQSKGRNFFMEVSPTLDIISAIVPTSRGGTEIQPRTDISCQPDPFQPNDSGPPPADDPDSPRGNLLNPEAQRQNHFKEDAYAWRLQSESDPIMEKGINIVGAESLKQRVRLSSSIPPAAQRFFGSRAKTALPAPPPVILNSAAMPDAQRRSSADISA